MSSGLFPPVTEQLTARVLTHLKRHRITMAVVRETREVLYPTVYRAFTER